MSKRTRRRHTPKQKAALVRQHVVDKKPVSEICSAAQIQPSVFYKWERDLLAAAPALFAGRRAPSREQELEAKIAAGGEAGPEGCHLRRSVRGVREAKKARGEP
jgi:transposase-like protein